MKGVAVYRPSYFLAAVFTLAALTLQGCNLVAKTPTNAAAYLVECDNDLRRGLLVEARENCFHAINLPGKPRTHEAAARRLVVISLMLDRREDANKLAQILAAAQESNGSSALVGTAYLFSGRYANALKWFGRCGSDRRLIGNLIQAAHERATFEVDRRTASDLLSIYCPAEIMASNSRTQIGS